MEATISADIISSTSLEPGKLKKITEGFEIFNSYYKNLIKGFWGRVVKGDYIECYIPDARAGLRIALSLKTLVKSYLGEKAGDKEFQMYGIRIAIGVGQMRVHDEESQMLDGDAIYLSGRTLEKKSLPVKGTMHLVTSSPDRDAPMMALCQLVDALINDANFHRCRTIYYKLQRLSEKEIGEKLGKKSAGIYQMLSKSHWYAIDAAIKSFEKYNFD